MTNWNTPNIPPIKTEPGEASPQPFNLYRAPSEMTPSPQPLSPPTTYNPSASSPYNVTVGGNTPSHQYRGGTGGAGGGIRLLNTDSTPAQMEIHNEYNVYGGEQQQQQQQQQQQHLQQSHLSPHYVRQNQLTPQNERHQQPHHQQQQQQQQFHGILYENANVGNWEEKFASVVANVGNTSETSMNNLNTDNNQFNMQNLLATATGVTRVAQHSQWNFPPNSVQDAQLQQQQQQQQHHHHHQQQLPSQQQQQQSNKNDVTMVDVIRGDAGGDVNNADIVEGGEQGPTISNLLNFDSEQLVHINSEEQQMIRLTSDELRLSNLSISS